jgi:hypothetical protein
VAVVAVGGGDRIHPQKRLSIPEKYWNTPTVRLQQNIVVSTDSEFRNVKKIEIVGLQRKSVLRAWVLVRNRQHCHLVHHGWNGQ